MRETDPLTSDSVVCLVLACTVYQAPGMLHLEQRETRDWTTHNEYSYNTAVRVL